MRKSLVPVVALLLGAALSAGADDDTPVPAEQRLVIHGYLTQAWAKSSEHQLLGIPNDGTFDYRRVALLVRGALTAIEWVAQPRVKSDYVGSWEAAVEKARAILARNSTPGDVILAKLRHAG